MQIDTHNFHEHSQLILQHIEQAHFIAFDCEFTGLVTQLDNIEGSFPNELEFYQRIKETALNFNLLQLGLTLFHFENGQYFPKSYNFYVSALHKKGSRQIILSEWESMAFLAKNGMDFNRVFKAGIKFKRIFNEQQKQNIQSQHNNEPQQKIFFNPKDKETIQKIEAEINKGCLKINFKTKKILDFFKSKYDMSLDKPKKDMDRYEYVIKIYQTLKPENNNQKSKMDAEEVVLVEKKEEVHLEQKHQAQLGLEILIKNIIDCKKPIVGHFPNLDIGLIYHSFIAQLPENYSQFSNKINELFPYIFDTKVISRRLQGKLKSIKVDLKSLYKACFNKKLLQDYANINYKYVQNYLKQESSHQAGYDSFMTGCAFIAMLNYLYNVEHHPFVFANAYAENKVLYSRFSGEVSLVGPIYNQRAEQFKKKIIIYSGSRQNKMHIDMGQQLSKFGTLTMHQNHGQIYYFFQDNQQTAAIVKEYKNLKRYEDRLIIKCRNFFK